MLPGKLPGHIAQVLDPEEPLLEHLLVTDHIYISRLTSKTALEMVVSKFFQEKMSDMFI